MNKEHNRERWERRAAYSSAPPESLNRQQARAVRSAMRRLDRKLRRMERRESLENLLPV